jgi:hypothetical protein
MTRLFVIMIAIFITLISNTARATQCDISRSLAALNKFLDAAEETKNFALANKVEKARRDKMFFEFLKDFQKNSGTDVLEYADLVSDINESGRRSVTLVGYSGLASDSYKAELGVQLEKLVSKMGDNVSYVAGGTTGGIGDAYKYIPEIVGNAQMAERNIKMSGIVSRNAAEWGVAAQDSIVFVDTPVNSWEVIQRGRSLTAGIAKDTDGIMVAFKGGGVAYHELKEALENGVKVVIVANERLSPDAAKVAKRIKQAAESGGEFIVDGTEKLLKEIGDHPNLTVVSDIDELRL